MESYSIIKILCYLGFIYIILKKKNIIYSAPFMSVMLYFGILFVYNPKIAYFLGIPVIIANLSQHLELFNSNMDIDIDEMLLSINNSFQNTQKDTHHFNRLRTKNKKHIEYLKKDIENKNNTFKMRIENKDKENNITYQLYDYSIKNLPLDQYTKLNNQKHGYQIKGEHLENNEKKYKENVSYQNRKIKINNDLIQKVEGVVKKMNEDINPKFEIIRKKFQREFYEFRKKIPTKIYTPLN